MKRAPDEQTDRIADDWIAAMLLAYQGPERPQRRPASHTMARMARRRRLASLGLVALAVLVVGGLLAAIRTSGSSGDAECAEGLRFSGISYLGSELPEPQSIQTGARLGTGVVPGCSDEAGEPVPDGERVTIRAIEQISPAVAVVRTDRPDLIYQANGRCYGFVGGSFLDCLGETLRFRDARYSATRLYPEIQGAVVLLSSLGQGRLVNAEGDRSSVNVVEIEGISPQVAVALEGDSQTLYVAEGYCYVHAAAAFLKCLRAS